jgi:acyl-CoA thioester hydrolase
MQHLSLIPVRYAETDRMGVIHHSHYPVYFEQGRTEFFQQHLQHYDWFERQGLFAPVLSLHLEILGRATYGDILHLATQADWMRGLRLQMSYSIRLGSGTEVASGHTVHALVNQEMKPLHPRAFGAPYQLLRQVFGDKP